MRITGPFLALAAVCILGLFQDVSAQTSTPKKRSIMNYEIVGNDTLLVDEIPPAVIHPKQYMKRRDWRRYAQRVHNFSKAYPYALFVSAKIKETDSIFLARNYSSRQQDKYLNKLKEDLLNDFEPLLRKLTLKQGLMMIRLIDRECGLTPYYIIKRYLGGGTAGFWQGVARLFKGSLKQPYDKFNQDKDLEELVVIWQKGEFDSFYIWLFGKPRPVIPFPEKYRELAKVAQSPRR